MLSFDDEALSSGSLTTTPDRVSATGPGAAHPVTDGFSVVVNLKPPPVISLGERGADCCGC